MLGQNDTFAVALAFVVALVITIFAVFAGALAGSPADRGGAPAAACAEWTDGCVICSRTPQGLACSTPGIACVRGPERCLRP
jgi:hypothetical protein